MALSNIRKEPRRELTETAIGLLVLLVLVGGFVRIDYMTAVWIHDLDVVQHPRSTIPFAVAVVFSTIILLASVALTVGAVVIAHALGEVACNKLATYGLELRPRQRYR